MEMNIKDFNLELIDHALELSLRRASLEERSFAKPAVEMIADTLNEYPDYGISYFNDSLNYSCSSGCIGSLVYYNDTKSFYIEHLDDIEDFIKDFEDDLGETIKFDGARWNDASWFAFEETIRRVGDVYDEALGEALETKLLEIQHTNSKILPEFLMGEDSKVDMLLSAVIKYDLESTFVKTLAVDSPELPSLLSRISDDTVRESLQSIFNASHQRSHQDHMHQYDRPMHRSPEQRSLQIPRHRASGHKKE